MINFKKILYLELAIITISFLVILLIVFFPHLGLNITTWRKDLISTVVGSGLFSGIITGLFLYLQESNKIVNIKQELESYYHDELLTELRRIINKDIPRYNFSDGKRFYLGYTFANPLYDLTRKDKSKILQYLSFCSANRICEILIEIEYLLDGAIPTFGMLDNKLGDIVRTNHHKANIGSINDPKAVQYLKASIFTDITKDNILKYIDEKKIPERMIEMKKKALRDKQVAKYKSVVETTRAKALKNDVQLIKLLKKEKT
jgi:hypothetical protein